MEPAIVIYNSLESIINKIREVNMGDVEDVVDDFNLAIKFAKILNPVMGLFPITGLTIRDFVSSQGASSYGFYMDLTLLSLNYSNDLKDECIYRQLGIIGQLGYAPARINVVKSDYINTFYWVKAVLTIYSYYHPLVNPNDTSILQNIFTQPISATCGSAQNIGDLMNIPC